MGYKLTAKWCKRGLRVRNVELAHCAAQVAHDARTTPDLYRAEAGTYMMRRRWGYFVRYLQGAEPPHEYQLHSSTGPTTIDGNVILTVP
jgi:hypothetical protein